MDNKSQSSLETDHCRSGFWEDDQGRDAIDTTQLCRGDGRWEWNAGEINQRTYGMEGFPNQDLFVQVFFCKGSCNLYL